MKGRNKSRNIVPVERKSFHKERPKDSQSSHKWDKKGKEQLPKMKQFPIKTSIYSWDGQHCPGTLHDFVLVINSLKRFWSRKKSSCVANNIEIPAWQKPESSSRGEDIALEDVQMGVITHASPTLSWKLGQPSLSVSNRRSEKGGIIESHCPETLEWPWASQLTLQEGHFFIYGMWMKPNRQGVLQSANPNTP